MSLRSPNISWWQRDQFSINCLYWCQQPKIEYKIPARQNLCSRDTCIASSMLFRFHWSSWNTKFDRWSCPLRTYITISIRKSKQPLIISSDDDKAIVMNNNLNYFFLETCTPNLKTVINADTISMNLSDIDLALLINRYHHTSFSSFQRYYSWLMLSKLTHHHK